MSALTLQQPLNDSDSEDEDYVPADVQSSDDEDDEKHKAKRARLSTPTANETDEVEKKRQRDELWASFQASVEATSRASNPPVSAPVATVTIEKRFRFAGEEVIEAVQVPENSPDAQKWPRIPSANSDPSVAQSPPQQESNGISTVTTLQTPQEPTPAPTPAPKRPPGPRKSKASLAMAAMATIPTTAAKSKLKKLSTLDKSAMDWRAHIDETAASSGALKDELEANRRGGGYLEKVEFLERVDSRREDVLEAVKGSKRRRG